MAKKAKIVMTNGTYVIVDKTVADAKTAIDAADSVSLPVSKKAYNYNLNTINIGEKTVPAYDIVNGEVVVYKANVQCIEEADEDLATVYTGTATTE